MPVLIYECFRTLNEVRIPSGTERGVSGFWKSIGQEEQLALLVWKFPPEVGDRFINKMMRKSGDLVLDSEL